jgi:hypothetical protein
MLLCFVGVARAAVNRLELFGMGKLLSSQISVATCALKCSVRRGPQASLVEGGWRSRLPLACAGAGFVATHARLTSRQGLGLLGFQGHSKKNSSQTSSADSDQETLLPSEIHPICPTTRAFMVEFHSTS